VLIRQAVAAADCAAEPRQVRQSLLILPREIGTPRYGSIGRWPRRHCGRFVGRGFRLRSAGNARAWYGRGDRPEERCGLGCNEAGDTWPLPRPRRPLPAARSPTA